MDKFWQAWENSTVITGSLVIMFGATACYMWANGIETPDPLIHLVEVLIGAFIGSRATKTAIQRAR